MQVHSDIMQWGEGQTLEFTLWLLFMESSRSGGGGRDGEEVRGGCWSCTSCILICVLVVNVSKKPTKLLTLQMWAGD